MILTTHYMEEAENLCDYIIIMHNGVILKEGTIDQLIDDNENEKVVEFTSENNLVPDILNESGLPLTIHREGNIDKGYVTISNFENDLPAFLSLLKSKNIILKHMECRRKTLDDLFVELTGRKIND
jgi:ABC-2 type transport system ATP-binding protein